MGAQLCHGSELRGFMYSFRICMWQYPSHSVNCTGTYALSDNNGFPGGGCLRHARPPGRSHRRGRQIKTAMVSEVPQPYEKPKWYRRSLSEIPEEHTTLYGGLPL